MSWIATYSGRKVDLVDPRPEQFHLPDIAMGLARTARFNGHTHEFYSVAQHSVYASELCVNALAALMHDASEAYMADVNRPLKDQLPGYRELEGRVMAAIAERFGFEWPLPPDVKEADNRLLVTERNLLQPRGPEWGEEYRSIKPLPGFEIRYQSPTQAENLFLARFRELSV